MFAFVLLRGKGAYGMGRATSFWIFLFEMSVFWVRGLWEDNFRSYRYGICACEHHLRSERGFLGCRAVGSVVPEQYCGHCPWC